MANLIPEPTYRIVIAFWITYGTQYVTGEWAWRLPFLLQMVPGLVLGVGILFLPFSPRWLVSKGRVSEAGSSLSKLRQLDITDSRVQKEWIDIRAEVAFHKEVSAERHPNLQDGSAASRMKLEIASWTDCFRRGCWRRTHVGVGLMFFQQFVGINALVGADIRFPHLGRNHWTSERTSAPKRFTPNSGGVRSDDPQLKPVLNSCSGD